MNIRISIALCCAFLCTTGFAFGQSQSPQSSAVNRNIPPLTPAEKATLNEVDRLDKAAQAAININDYVEAEVNARQSVALGVFSGLGQQYLAAALYQQGKTQEALAAYQSMISSTTNGVDFFATYSIDWPVYALLLLQTGQWKQAVAIYNTPHYGEGVDQLLYVNSHISPAVPEPNKLEAYLHIALGVDKGWAGYSNDIRRPLQTLSEFQKALALEPNSALTNYYYGYGLQDAGRFADAKATFAKAAALGVGDVKAAAEKALR